MCGFLLPRRGLAELRTGEETWAKQSNDEADRSLIPISSRFLPLRMEAVGSSESFHASLLSRCHSIILLSGARAIVSFRCCAKAPKLTVVDHTSTSSLDLPTSDNESLSSKKLSRQTRVPTKTLLQANRRSSAKRAIAFKAFSTEAMKLSESVDVEVTRSKLERLSVEEPALFKYVSQAAMKDVSVDQIVSYVSSLMGIARVSWNEAVAMLSKTPSILSLDASKLDQSVVFLSDMGLSMDEIAAVLVSHPSFFEYDTKEMKRSVEYLISVGLPEDDVAIVFRERPQALNAKMEDVVFSMECLLEAQVLPEDFARILSRAPDLFSPSSREHLKSRLQFFHKVGLSGGSLGKGIARRPNLLHFDLEAMKQAYDYLSEFLAPNDMSKLVCRYAEVLVIDPKRKMEPMVNHLLRLGVKPSNLGKVLLRRPQLLGYTIAGLEPTIQYLRELGVTEKMLGRLISISPQVLTLNCEEKLKPAVEYVRSIGLTENKDLKRLLVRNAQLLCYSFEKNLTPKFSFFLGMGLKREDVIKMIVLFPSMFGQNLESSLEPKYRYLVDVMKRSPKDIVNFPQYFGYSLENRIKPRYEKLVERGITGISLPSMLVCVEADFITRYLNGPPRARASNKIKKAPSKSKYTD